MKNIKPLLITAAILLSQASFANSNKQEEGGKLFEVNCAACHGATVGGMDISKRIAPPIAAVRMHYIDTYPDEASFIQAVSSWVKKQDENKSLMRGAIQKFKIMPPLVVAKEDAEKIAAFIYSGDIEKPEGFEEHVKEEHGKVGMGKDKHDQGESMNHQGMKKHQMQENGMNHQGMGKHQMQENGMNHQGMGKHQMQGNDMNHQGMGMPQMRGNGMGRQGMGKYQMRGSGMNHQDMKMRQMQNGIGNQMMQQLNLTPQQQQKMQVLIQEKQSKLLPVKKQLQQINQTIRQLDTNSPDYKSQIFSLADEKAKRVHRMVIERGEMRMKIESLLNTQQRALLKQLKQQRRQNTQTH